MIIADHLHKRFEDGHVAVKDATFEIKAGETLGLLGGNGAGKSTTIHMLLGNIPPTSGQSFIAGHCMQEDPLEAKKHLGYVSENVLLYGPLTAEQNLRFFARISGGDVPREREEMLLERVGLGSAAKRRVETFSKGMRQRLGIAIALVKDPEALLLDEPTTGLDPVGVRELNDLMISLRDEGKAILLVTHDLFRLNEVADRITVMRDRALTEPVVARSVDDVTRLYMEAVGAAVVANGGAAVG
ncbi:MAG TPA: ABC transporter ATP-binding protein [Candidatus Thermoplasmatota archaeon]|nr:ABC transporter ATP-binding protein [Candidatus Thermoplasmatota archaeon]